MYVIREAAPMRRGTIAITMRATSHWPMLGMKATIVEPMPMPMPNFMKSFL